MFGDGERRNLDQCLGFLTWINGWVMMLCNKWGRRRSGVGKMRNLMEREALEDTQLNKSRGHVDMWIRLRPRREAGQEKEMGVTH